MSVLAHATAVAALTPDGWRAALLRGASGAGKSDLALRLIQAGWRLVGDDYVEVWACEGAAYCRGADRLGGLVEARGVGLTRAVPLPLSRIGLIADCGGRPERMPEPAFETLAGVATPRLDIAALEASAPAKLFLAIDPRRAVALGADPALAY